MTTERVENLALVAHAAGDVRIEDVPLNPLAADEAVIRISYGGICGSDLHYWKHGAAGESVLREPMVLGHEIVGIVECAAADGSGPVVGTPVTVHPARSSATAVRFPSERPNLSPTVTYLGSAAHLPHTAGAFAARVAFPTAMLHVLPTNLPLRTSVLIEPTSVAWHAVSRAGAIGGKRVLVVGSGPIGALAVAVLKRAGAGEIVAVDVFDKPLEIAHALGADVVLKAGDVDAIAAVDADIAIESSGNHRGLASAIAGTTRGGRVVMVGLLPSGDQPVPISLAITRELELIGSFRFHREIDDVIRALADGSLTVDSVITHEFPLADALEALVVAADASQSGKVVLAF
ncbi:L-idonate 5-dehydrogenase [Luethyella okanaganae]|uniref:L-idonate 5-dehydrogenase n=1 Tax=Luethyella okanaganae TaxID=69372 RepID=A0ABW1VA52_9MICO